MRRAHTDDLTQSTISYQPTVDCRLRPPFVLMSIIKLKSRSPVFTPIRKASNHPQGIENVTDDTFSRFMFSWFKEAFKTT